MSQPSNLKEMIDLYRVVVLLGPGGTGKTTTSIAIALAAAAAGKKVGLLSIDPAKRLAAALNMSVGSSLKPLEFSKHRQLEGRVDAAMLDQKAVFDGMVRKHAPSEKVARRILDHPLYQAASSKLAGPLEYMALAKLQEIVESGHYDLVVLDTPPDTHALDFLKRPNILAGFMENKVMSWLVKPFHVAAKLGAGKLFSTGEKLMGGVAKVTGFKALSTLAEFLVLMQEVIDGFHTSGEKIVKILSQKSTGFFLITTPSPAASRSAANLASQTKQMGYPLELLICNRCLPVEVAKNLDAYPSVVEELSAQCRPLASLRQRKDSERRLIERLTRSLRHPDASDTDGLPNTPVLAVDEQAHDLHSEDAILDFAGTLQNHSLSR